MRNLNTKGIILIIVGIILLSYPADARRIQTSSVQVNLHISSEDLKQRVARILNNRRIVEILNKIQNVSPETRIYILDLESEGFVGATGAVIYSKNINSLSHQIEERAGAKIEFEDGFINITQDMIQKSDEYAITGIEHELWHIYRFLAEPREVLRWSLWRLFDFSARKIPEHYRYNLQLSISAVTDFNLSMYQIKEGSANVVILNALLPVKINRDKEDVFAKGELKLRFIAEYTALVLPFYTSSSEAQKNGDIAQAEELKEQGDNLRIIFTNNYSDFLSEDDIAKLIAGPIVELEKELKKRPYPRIKKLIGIMQPYWYEYDSLLF